MNGIILSNNHGTMSLFSGMLEIRAQSVKNKMVPMSWVLVTRGCALLGSSCDIGVSSELSTEFHGDVQYYIDLPSGATGKNVDFEDLNQGGGK